MCKLLGITYNALVVHLVHGEADRLAAAAVYKSYLVELQNDLQTDINTIIAGTGIVKLVISQLSVFTSYSITTSNVPSDQTAAARENPTKIVLVGSKNHLNTNDGTHLVNTKPTTHRTVIYERSFLQGGTRIPIGGCCHKAPAEYQRQRMDMLEARKNVF